MSLQHQLCFEMYKAANQFTKMYAKVLQPFHLTYVQYIVLLALQEKDGQTISSLCQRLSLGIGTLHPVLHKLVDKGWLIKTPSLDDRRASHFVLSTQAKQAQPKIEQALYEKLARYPFFAQHGPALQQQIAQLNDDLTRLNQEEF